MSKKSLNISNKPLFVSVAMATYNGEKYLQTQLESISNQNRLPDELIICDDNSTDSTVAIIEAFAKHVSFKVIIILNSQNQGFVFSFNKALEASNGDLVFLCDQDDFWFPEKIEHIINLSAIHPHAKLFMANAELVDGNLETSGFTTFGQIEAIGQNTNELVLGCCMAVRREFLNLCLPIPGNFEAHDIFLHKYAMFLNSNFLIPKVLQLYRRHQKNETAHIVYSLKKINYINYVAGFYKNLVSTPKLNSFNKRISNNSILINSLEISLEKADGEDKIMLEAALENLVEETAILKARQKISSMRLYKRLMVSSRLWISGGYKSGVKSFIRDITGF